MLSRPLNTWRHCRSSRFQHAIQELIQAMDTKHPRSRARKPADAKSMETTLSALVLDLYTQFEVSSERFIRVHLGRSYYSDPNTQRYQNAEVTYKSTKQAIELLEERNWIEVRKGFYDQTNKIGRPTAVRAKPELITLLKTEGLSLCDISSNTEIEGIILKSPKTGSKPKQKISYIDTEETHALRKTLKALNAFTSSHTISLDITPEELADLKYRRSQAQQEALRKGDKDIPCDIDLTATHMKRVFNNGSFCKGGRFYGPWWQNIPRSYRPHILIDGEPTIELDYGGMHPIMLYQINGFDIPTNWDPYDIPSLEDIPRSVKKSVFNQLINGKDHTKMNFKNDWNLQTPLNFQEVAEKIMEHHSCIKDHFLSGAGLELQYLDSQIAEDVMISLMNEGILALCIHDSFIVPESSAERLKEVMNGSYLKIIKKEPIIK